MAIHRQPRPLLALAGALLFCSGAAGQGAASRPAEPLEVVQAQAAAREYSAKLHAFKLPPAVSQAKTDQAVAACIQALAEGGGSQSAAYAEKLRQVLARHGIQTAGPTSVPAAQPGAPAADDLVRLTVFSEHLAYLCWLGRTGAASIPPALRQDIWAAIAADCPGSLARVRAAYFLTTSAVAKADGKPLTQGVKGKPAFPEASSPAVALAALDSAVGSILLAPAEGAAGADAILAVNAARSLGIFREDLWLRASAAYPAGAAELPTREAVQALIRPARPQAQSAPADKVRGSLVLQPLAAERDSLLADAPAIVDFLSGRWQVEKLMGDFFAAVTQEDKAALNACLADDKTRAQYGQFTSLRKALVPSDEAAEPRHEALKPLGRAAAGQAEPEEVRIRAEAYFTWTAPRGRSGTSSLNLILVKTPAGWRVGGR